VSGPDQRRWFETPAFLWGPVVLQMIVIFIASSIPYLGALPGGMSDKSGHGIGYGILGALLLRALSGGRLQSVTWPRVAAALVLATLYGISDEFHQSFVPGRSPDAMDVLADSIGAALAVGVAGGARAWGILRFSPRFRGLR
jgi:hypothetical protein